MKTAKTKSKDNWPANLFKKLAAPVNSQLHSDMTDVPTRMKSASEFECLDKIFADNCEVKDFSDKPVFNHHNVTTLKSVSCQVIALIDEAYGVKTIRLLPEAMTSFCYLPGQYVILNISIAEQNYKRSYSLASSPTRPGTLDITVKKVPDGIVSTWLNEKLKVGDSLSLSGPFGSFSCALHAHEKLLFVAVGSGVVPMMSMLRWLADTKPLTDIVAVFGFRNQKDIIYFRELQLMQRQLPNFKLEFTLTGTQSQPLSSPTLSGRINSDMSLNIAPDLSDREIYLCGPDAFMANLRRQLQTLVPNPSGAIHSESFNVKNKFTTLRSDKNRSESIISESKVCYQIKCAKSDKMITSDGSASLLELAFSAGVVVDYECLRGDCGECMIKCLEGVVEMDAAAEIPEQDKKQGWVYACCSYPKSNIVLEI